MVGPSPVEMMQRGQCVPMFEGNKNELSGGKKEDAVMVNFSASYIHPEKGYAKEIAQIMTLKPISWEEIRRSILTQFSQKKKI